MTCKHTRDWAPWFQLQSERACPSWWHIFFTLSRACWTCRWPDGTSPPLIRSYGKRCTLGEFERIFCKPPQQWTTSGIVPFESSGVAMSIYTAGWLWMVWWFICGLCMKVISFPWVRHTLLPCSCQWKARSRVWDPSMLRYITVVNRHCDCPKTSWK